MASAPPSEGQILVDGVSAGAGFFINGHLLITARHVIKTALDAGDRLRTDKRLEVDLGPDHGPVLLILLRTDRTLDVAVLLPELLLDNNAPAHSAGSPHQWSESMCGAPVEGAKWKVTTSPKSNDPALTGIVTVPARATHNSKGFYTTLMQLEVNQQLGNYKGYSGSPVWSRNTEPPTAIGVIVEQVLRRGGATRPEASNVLWAAPMPAVLDALGLSGNVLCPRSGRQHRGPLPYQATVREVAARTKRLADREVELESLRRFTMHGGQLVETGAPGNHYGWILAGPWAGKTALAASVAASLLESAEVDLVAYFMSAREATASIEKFLIAAVKQLSAILGEEVVETDRDSFWRLWQVAAERADTAQRPLVLLVDGLDEDVNPGTRYSVASSMPSVGLGQWARVLVTSRPAPDVCKWVDPGHPLRLADRIELSDSAFAVEVRTRAEAELSMLRDINEFARSVFNTMAVAAGPLTTRDLAELTSKHNDARRLRRSEQKIRSLLYGAAARSTQISGGDSGDGTVSFAHVTLLESASTGMTAREQRQGKQRFREWAIQWQRNHWATAADDDMMPPRYLLESYPSILLRNADEARSSGRSVDLAHLADLVTDIQWIDAAVDRLGVDSVIANLRAACRYLPGPDVAGRLAVLKHLAHVLSSPKQEVVGASTVLLTWEFLRRGQDVSALLERLRTLPGPQILPLITNDDDKSGNLSTFPMPDGTVVFNILAISDGRLVVARSDIGDQISVELINVSNPDKARVVIGPLLGQRVHAIASMGDGRLVIATSIGFTTTHSSIYLIEPSEHAAAVYLGTTKSISVSTLTVLRDNTIAVASGGQWLGAAVLEVFNPGAPDFSLIHQVDTSGYVRAINQQSDGTIVLAVQIPMSSGSLIFEALDEARREMLLLSTWPADQQTAVIPLSSGAFLFGFDGSMQSFDPSMPDEVTITPFPGHLHDLDKFASLPDGRLVRVSWNGDIDIINPSSASDQPRRVGSITGQPARVCSSPEGWFAVASQPEGKNAVVQVFDSGVAAFQRSYQLTDPINVSTLEPISKGWWVAATQSVRDIPDRIVAFHPEKTEPPFDVLTPGRESVTAIHYLKGDLLAISSAGRQDWPLLEIFDLENPQAAPVRPQGSRQTFTMLTLPLPDGRIVVAGNVDDDEAIVSIWDPAEPERLQQIAARADGRIQVLDALADGRIVVVSGRNADPAVVEVFELDRPDQWVAIGRTRGNASPLATLPDGSVVVVSHDDPGGLVEVFNAPARPGPLVSFDDVGGQPAMAVVTLDDGRLMMASDSTAALGTLEVVDPSGIRPTVTISAGGPFKTCFSRGDRYIVFDTGSSFRIGELTEDARVRGKKNSPDLNFSDPGCAGALAFCWDQVGRPGPVPRDQGDRGPRSLPGRRF